MATKRRTKQAKPAARRATLTEGQRLFEAFVARCGLTQLAIAAALGVSDVTIWFWRTGEKRPVDHQRAKIEAWTNGAIPAVTWRTAEERVEIRNTRPFMSTGTDG